MDCFINIDRGNETRCSFFDKSVETCLAPTIKYFEECLKGDGKTLPRFLLDQSKAVHHYFCSISTEQLFGNDSFFGWFDLATVEIAITFRTGQLLLLAWNQIFRWIYSEDNSVHQEIQAARCSSIENWSLQVSSDFFHEKQIFLYCKLKDVFFKNHWYIEIKLELCTLACYTLLLIKTIRVN